MPGGLRLPPRGIATRVDRRPGMQAPTEPKGNETKAQETEARLVTSLHIGGRWVSGAGGEAVPILNPFDNRPIAEVAPASPAQVDEAILAAATAFRDPAWANLTGRERGELLHGL